MTKYRGINLKPSYKTYKLRYYILYEINTADLVIIIILYYITLFKSFSICYYCNHNILP